MRKIKKEKLSDVMKRVYDGTVAHDPGHYPTFVHYSCQQKLLNPLQRNGRAVTDLYVFPVLTPGVADVDRGLILIAKEIKQLGTGRCF